MAKMRIYPGNVYGVYAITVDTIPGKVYIGMTHDFEQRFKQHIGSCIKALSGGLPSSDLYHEFRSKKCHRNDIKFHIMAENLTYEEAHAKEAELILDYRSYDPKYGWNKASEVYHLKDVNVDRVAPPLPKND